MVILLDVDGVVADSTGALLAAVNDLYERDHRPEDVTAWEFEHCLCLHRDELEAAWARVDLANIPPCPGAIEGVRELMRHADVAFVTAPHPRLKEWGYWRAEWLNAYFPQCRIVSTRHKELVAGDMLVDDKPENLYAWLKANPRGTGVLWSAPHNRRAGLPANACRMGDWSTLKLLVKGLR